jgi:hypothetical protein
MRKRLSHKKFSRLSAGSRELQTTLKGKGSGYYVSRDPRVPVEIGGGLEDISNSHDVSTIKEHFQKAKEIAGKVVPLGWMRGRAATESEKENIHQGIWNDRSTGQSYLDVSDRIGGRASRSSLREALERGIAHDQLAIHVGGTGKDLPIRKKVNGQKKINPAAEMQITYLKQQEDEAKKRKNMSPKKKAHEKAQALEAFDKAFPRKGA